jgi:PAS domain S-box-containing protein
VILGQSSFTSWNKGAERIFGYSAEEIWGAHSFVLTASGRVDGMPDVIQRIAHGERVQ